MKTSISKASTRDMAGNHHIVIGGVLPVLNRRPGWARNSAGTILRTSCRATPAAPIAGRDGQIQHCRQLDGLRLHRPLCLPDAVQDAPGRAVWMAAGIADQFAAFPAQGDSSPGEASLKEILVRVEARSRAGVARQL